jgi:hypothetical protein
MQFERGQANQPDSTFPQSPGIILETTGFNLTTAVARFRSFNELPAAYPFFPIRQRNLMHNLLTDNRVGTTLPEFESLNKSSLSRHRDKNY